MSTYILQPHGADSRDCDILSSKPTTNYGSSTLIAMGESNATTQIARLLLLFEQLSNGYVPRNRNVKSAVLSLYLSDDASSNARTYSFFRLKREFIFSQATWNLRKTGEAWAVAGVYSASNSTDYERADPIATLSLSASEADGFKNWDLDTAKVFELINGVFPNYGLFGMCDGENNDQYIFRSGNHATESSHPKLTIEIDDYSSDAIIL